MTRANRVASTTPMPLILGDLSVHYPLDDQRVDVADLFQEEVSNKSGWQHLSLAIAPANTPLYHDGWRVGLTFDNPLAGTVARGFSIRQEQDMLAVYETRAETITGVGTIGCGNPFPQPEEAIRLAPHRPSLKHINLLTRLVTTKAFRDSKEKARQTARIAASLTQAGA